MNHEDDVEARETRKEQGRRQGLNWGPAQTRGRPPRFPEVIKVRRIKPAVTRSGVAFPPAAGAREWRVVYRSASAGGNPGCPIRQIAARWLTRDAKVHSRRDGGGWARAAREKKGARGRENRARSAAAVHPAFAKLRTRGTRQVVDLAPMPRSCKF